jgi:peptidyl-prolyl cis-trans isomerase D
MLQSLRDKAQGWFAWLIIGAIAITFILFGTGSMFDSGGGKNDIVAKVNGSKIYAQTLDAAYQRFLHQPGAESIRYMDPAFIKRELLQSLIDEKVLLKWANHMGMTISPTRVDATIQGLPFLLQDGRFSNENYHRFLINANYTNEGFKELVSNSLVKDQLQQGVIHTSFSLDQDIESIIKYAMQKRDIRYLTIARQNFENEIKISNEDIKNYYEGHSKDFLTD